MTQPPVTGVREALRVLNGFDKTLRKQFNKDFKDAVDPMVRAAQRNVPTEAPLSGMTRNWKGQPLWRGGSTERRQITSKLDTRKASRKITARSIMYETVGVVSVVAGGGKARNGVSRGRNIAIYDMAGRGNKPSTVQGMTLINRLNAKQGKASRAMWPAAEETLNDVTQNCRPIVDRAVADANRALRTATARGVR
jgi:hypothetical protein